MAYKDNVAEMCGFARISNPIQENDVPLAAVVFYGPGGEFLFTVAATEMNRAGRYYVHDRNYRKEQVFLTQSTRERDAEFFTPQLWDDCRLDHRPLVYGLKTAYSMKLVYK